MDDATIKSLITQAPMVVLLIYAIKALYVDMKAERVQASLERQAMLAKIDLLANTIDNQTVALARVERACGADLLPPIQPQKQITGVGS